ncbi:MAG: hypothetical protein MJ025_06325 [Victivallaceae bacterium]|nr:hypothetical protein [Victivallaceae bacterium]
MAKMKRVQMFGKLNATAYRAIESATVLCKTRGNPYVELTHWVNQILMSDNTDWHCAIKYFELDEALLSKDLVAALDRLPRGATSISNFANSIEVAIKEAWMATSLVFNEGAIRTGHLLLAARDHDELSRFLLDISREFAKINADILQEKFSEVVSGSSETSVAAPSGAPGATGQAGSLLAPASMGKGEALRLYTIDMTENARQGTLDPRLGRDADAWEPLRPAARTIRSSPARPGSARPRWSRDSPSAWRPATCRTA